MKRFFALLMLLSLLVLAACSDTVPEVATPGDAGTNVASFKFDIDISAEQVSVTQLAPESLGTQQYKLDPDTQLKLENARYIFGANNTLTIKATFTNVTSNTTFLQPFSFGPATSPEGGNYLLSTEPTVTDADLGGNGALSPGETTATLTFTVEHKGQRFSYRVNAYAQLDFLPEDCGADGTFDDYVTITTQADIDALRGCTKITGDFFVNTDAQTLDFSPLDDLQTVGGLFEFVNPNLISISGFNNLKSVGSFYVNSNPSLISLTGFEKLSETDALVIADNPLLTSVPEFNGVTNILNDFLFINNDALTTLSGFGSLKTAATFFEGSFGPFATFRIGDNASLVSVSGFEQLERVNRFDGLRIDNNPSLVSLPSFGNLKGGTPTIKANDSLTSLTGFGALSYGRRLEISDNPALISIPEFRALASAVGIGIRNNDALVSFSLATTVRELAYLNIIDNGALVSFSGFEDLASIYPRDLEVDAGVLSIENNASLTSISGFDSLSSSFISEASLINDNPVFDCSIPPQSNLPFLPVDESTGNLVNCPTR